MKKTNSPVLKKRPAYNPEGHNGQEPKLDDELVDKLCKLIRMGAYVETCAASLNISKQIFYKWLKRGSKEKTGKYRRLVDSLHKAVADAELRDLASLDRFTTGTKAEFLRDKDGEIVRDGDNNPVIVMPGIRPDWKAAAWKLERRLFKRWGARQVVEHLPGEGEEKTVETMTDAELEAEYLRLRKANRHADEE